MDDPEDFIPDEDDPRESDPDAFFLKAVGFELLLGVLGLGLGALLSYDARQYIPRLDSPTAIFAGIGWGVVATIPMLVAVFILDHMKLTGVEEVSRLTKDRLLAPMRNLTVLELVAISLCAGLGEELLFRGFLQGWIIGPLDTASPGLIFFGVFVASLAFGLVHAMTPTYFVLASAVGVYLGVITIATENLIVPIVAHALYDAVQLILALRAKPEEADEAEEADLPSSDE